LKEFLTKDIREEVKKDIEQKVSEINKQIIENKKDTLRVTLMQLIAANKKETYSEIFKLYDEYKQLGGNGYIDGTIAERKKENNIY
jgi:hypothetical protein